MGAVLLQQGEDGRLWPCAYLSKKFTDTERNWPVWENEAAAIKLALRSWWHLLEGAWVPFEIWTDHKNLEALKHPRKLRAKNLRWAHLFSHFRFTLHHLPGKQKFLVDALSRMPQHDSTCIFLIQSVFSPSHLGGMVSTRTTKSFPSSPSDLTARIIQASHAEPPPVNLGLSQLDSGLWMKDHTTYVPPSLRLDILRLCHYSPRAGHFGFIKTLHLLNRQFWWPGFRKDVAQYISGCPICLLAKNRGGKPPGKLIPLPTPSRPWSHLWTSSQIYPLLKGRQSYGS